MAARPGVRARRRVLVVVIALVIALVGAAGWAWFVWLPNYRPALRAGERLGIDVSHHQGEIDWRQVAGDGMTFAYIKATEGADLEDDRFAQNWAGAGGSGLDRGAYHFFTLCSPGEEQARNFLRVLNDSFGELPPALDLELDGNCAARPDRPAVVRELVAFLDLVEEETRVPTVLYLGDDFEERYEVMASLERPSWELRFLRRPEDDWFVWQ